MATKQPADKSHFILPDLGEGVHEAELIRWRVKPGDHVAEHQTLAEMETDKALVEVPSPWAGTIRELHGSEGDVLLVGNTLVSYESSAQAAPAGDARDAGAARGEKAGKGTARAERSGRAGSEAAGAGESGVADAGTVVGSVDTALRVSETFTRRRAESEAPAQRGRALATPAVRRIARERGVDIDQITGSGRGGRVTAHDVEAFVPGRGGARRASAAAAAGAVRDARAETTGAPRVAVPAGRPAMITERIPFRGVRRKIAEALERSVRTAVHFTVVDEADVTAIDARRREYAHVLGRKLSLLPFVMVAVCRALRMHPALNAVVDDEHEEIVRRSTIDLGCAVDTDHGLMVPVIRGADQRSLVDLSDEVSRLAAACRNRTIERERLIGGSFTISNVGSYGGLFATPIINYPEVGILAVGRMHEKVFVRQGTFYAGKALPLSLSCDHRVVDGAEGARFLESVRVLLESPEELLAQRS